MESNTISSAELISLSKPIPKGPTLISPKLSAKPIETKKEDGSFSKNNKVNKKHTIDKNIMNEDGSILPHLVNKNKNIKQPEMSTYIKRGNDFWKDRKLSKVAYWYHLVCFASSMILSASCFSWNHGLDLAGFPLYTLCVLLTSLGFQLLSMCLAEMCSGLPFSGGSYGFVRATIGMDAGMFIGLIESFEYMLTTSVNVVQCTALLSIIFGTDPGYNIMWDLMLLILATTIQVIGGELYWNCIIISGVLTIAVLLLYSFTNVSNWGQFYDNNAQNIALSGGTLLGFLKAFPNSIWFYVGIEALPLCCEETHEPKEQVPKGLLYGMPIIIIVTLFTYFTAVATPQTGFLKNSFILNAGYAFGWNLDIGYESNYRGLLILAFIPMISAAYSFVFAYGRQMFAMSRSGLLPSYFSLTSESTGTPYVSMIFGSAIASLVCFIIRFAGNSSEFIEILYNMMLITSLVNYLFQLAAYIVLRLKYFMVVRSYQSPFGVLGAVIGFLIFLVSLVALLGWADNIWYSVVGVIIWVTIGMSYYYMISSKNLILSPEEQFSMFMVYSIKYAQNRDPNPFDADCYKIPTSI